MIRRGFARKVIVHKCQCETGTYYKLMKKDGKASCTVWIDRGCPIICDLYVSASHRRKGFATKMLQLCEDIVKAEGHPGAYLWAAEGCWCVEWYKRKGYKPTGETLLRPGETVTNIWMYKEL